MVSSYLEFYGEGATAMILGERATISNMTPEFGATAAMFSIDQQTIDYLHLTGRDDEQVKLVEIYAKQTGFGQMIKNEYERVLTFGFVLCGQKHCWPSNPHARVAVSDLHPKESLRLPSKDGLMPDGACIIAATSCTNFPRNMIAAGLIARNANKIDWPETWVKTSLAPGSKAVDLVPKEAGLLPELENWGLVLLICRTSAVMAWGSIRPKN